MTRKEIRAQKLTSKANAERLRNTQNPQQ
jgi:hypothetical protein